MRYLMLLSKVVLVACLLCGVLACQSSKDKQLYASLPINTDGNINGNIAVVEFLDYSDPSSLKMGAIMSEVMEKRPNVRIIYHPIALDSEKTYPTQLVLAASLQDRFLAAHHLLMNSPLQVSETQMIDTLTQAFVDPQALLKEARSSEVAALMLKNQQLAKMWDVDSVPTLFVGRMNNTPHKLVGLLTAEQIILTIDEVAH